MSISVDEPVKPKLKGHLRLVCGVDRTGASYLKEQDFTVPFHVGKAFQDAGVLVVNVANPTAGLFQGDSTRSELMVEKGGRLLVLNPSATRVHDTQAGWSQASQEIEVATGGWLEIFPELFIPQKGARHRQKTVIHVEPGGELCFLEMLAPGRVASGERFVFSELKWTTDILSGATLIARERFRITPGDKSLQALVRFSANAYVATFFLIAEKLKRDSPCWKDVQGFQARDLWIGSSELTHGGWVIKILAGDGHALRETVEKVRKLVHPSAGWTLADRRKL